MVFKSLIPPMILILGVLGSIFLGWATPTEAAGVGAALAFLMMVVYGKFTWWGLYNAVVNTARTNCMVIILLVGARSLSGNPIGFGTALRARIVARSDKVPYWFSNIGRFPNETAFRAEKGLLFPRFRALLSRNGQTPPAAPHLKHIVAETDEAPFSLNLSKASEKELTEASHLLDVAENCFNAFLAL